MQDKSSAGLFIFQLIFGRRVFLVMVNLPCLNKTAWIDAEHLSRPLSLCANYSITSKTALIFAFASAELSFLGVVSIFTGFFLPYPVTESLSCAIPPSFER